MGRDELKVYAKESLDLIKSGLYKDKSGKEYNIKDDLKKMQMGTCYYIKTNNSLEMVDECENTADCKIYLSTKDTLDAVRGQVERFGSSCGLNFASAKHPGGGFENGAKAQEEDLCYCSTLYGSLSLGRCKLLYDYSKKNLNNNLYSTWSVYSPNVVIYRDKLKNKISPVICSIISSPAPNKGAYSGKNVEVRKAMEERCEYILQTAIKHNERNLVLGAFGCGVFKNSPMEVATVWFNLLYKKNYSKYFDNIEFAILGRGDDENYKAFKMVFGRKLC